MNPALGLKGSLMTKFVAGTIVMLVSVAAWTLSGCGTGLKHPQNDERASAPSASPVFTPSGSLLRYPASAPAVSSGSPLP
jgi:hypothetical protein